MLLDSVRADNRELIFNQPQDQRSALQVLTDALGDSEQIRQEANITSHPAFRIAARTLKNRFADRAEFMQFLTTTKRANVIVVIQKIRAEL